MSSWFSSFSAFQWCWPNLQDRAPIFGHTCKKNTFYGLFVNLAKKSVRVVYAWKHVVKCCVEICIKPTIELFYHFTSNIWKPPRFSSHGNHVSGISRDTKIGSFDSHHRWEKWWVSNRFLTVSIHIWDEHGWIETINLGSVPTEDGDIFGAIQFLSILLQLYLPVMKNLAIENHRFVDYSSHFPLKVVIVQWFSWPC